MHRSLMCCPADTMFEWGTVSKLYWTLRYLCFSQREPGPSCARRRARIHQRRTCVQRRSQIDHLYNMVQIIYACTFHAMIWTNDRTQHVSLRSTLAAATLVSNTCTHDKLSYMMARLLFLEVICGCCQAVAYQKCYTEKASPTRHRPERQHNARANRRKQCSPNETKPYSKPTLPRKRQTTPTNGHTPRRHVHKNAPARTQ